jgi:hypothetical protein
MLTKRSVLILAAITAIVTAAAVTAQYSRWADTIRSVESEPAFPNIGEALAQVTRIKIVRAEDNAAGTFTFSRAQDRWTIDQKGGFSATESVIREMLLGFTELELIEAKTRDPKRFEKLNLSDTDKAGSKASRVILEDASGKVLLDALFGKRVPSISGGKPSIYLRRQGEDQTWLATGEIEIRAGAMQWLPTDLVSILRERIDRITLKAPGEEPLELIYDNAVHKRFEIADLPADLEISSRYRVLQAGILQERLGMRDVRPSVGLKIDPTLGGAVWRTNDGMTVTLDLAPDPKFGESKKVWALISVEVAADAKDKVAKEAADIAARTKGWAYWLGGQAMQKIWVKRASLTQKK